MILSGGVIRWAAGTPNAGQIVRHLLPSTGLKIHPNLHAPTTGPYLLLRFMSNGINPSLSALQITNHLAIFSNMSLLLSGLSVFAIALSFKLLSAKINKLNTHVGEILDLLKAQSRTKLKARIEELQILDTISTEDRRMTILSHVLPDLNDLYHLYMEQLSKINDWHKFNALEELFTLTATARAHAYAEFDITSGQASRIAQETLIFWQEHSRRIARDSVLSPNPQRFLSSNFVEQISTITLIDWMDFAHGESKGLLWIDELRRQITSRNIPINVNMQSVSRFMPWSSNISNEYELLISLMQRLVQRNTILETNLAQYQMLEDIAIPPSMMQSQLEQIPTDIQSQSFIVFKPNNLMM
ncbi:hypothetical protein [Herpetosiphon giganteus]|uniref:hypothetical protein n=1 Tax=Herpetosiphon giganteus TaxID=2029754 RepID=UPI00195CE0E5|nr:hypothetical protein [Herpetosiphon giganteus]MBM7843571.1 hypothetical protein [Herpetosiphon giganteus]